jgi:hypothetical protein
MSIAAVIVIVVVVVVAAMGAGFLLWDRARTLRLRRRFGPVYERAVARHDNRRTAERELRDRERRHHELDIQPLDANERARYREHWIQVQEQFVDSPEAALGQADRLVIKLMGDRGYPTEDFDQRVRYLSVEHGRTIDYYRRGHEISARAESDVASTEDMRQAMVHYRALFEDLLAVPAEERAEVPRPRESNGPAEEIRADDQRLRPAE